MELNHSEDARQRPRRRSVMALLGVALLLATLIAYLPVLGAEWIWDDDSYVTENALLRDFDGLRQIWIPRKTPQYYPVVFTSYWIEFQLWELEPLGFHVVNILLHGLNAILLWLVMIRLRVPGAWLIAAVFALHPVMVESVAWVTERKNVLSLFFYLAAALSYLRFNVMRFGPDSESWIGSERRSASRESWGWYGAAIVLFTLALLSKSVTCSLPAAIILALLWLREPVSLRRLAPLAPMFLIGFALAMNTAIIERAHVGAVGDDFDFTFLERCLIASRALLFYPGKLLWPHPLIFIYERWEIDAGSWTAYVPLLIGTLAGALLVGLYIRGWRGPFLAMAFFAGTVFPALGFFNVYPHLFSFVADHFQYHASIGFIALVVGGAVWLLRRPAAISVVAVILLPVLAGLTYRQAMVYESAESVWRDTIAKNPTAWMPRNNLASILLRRAEEIRAADVPEQVRRLAEEAAEHAAVSIRVRPDNHIAYANLSEAQRLLGREEKALASLDEAIRQAPHMLDYLWQKGRILELLGRRDQALETFREAVDRAPEGIGFRHDLARLLVREGRLEEADRHLAAILELQPDHYSALGTLAGVREAQGQYASAARLYRRAVDEAPTFEDQIQIVTRLIRFLAHCPDPSQRNLDEALSLAGQLAASFDWEDPASLLVLASVHAARGDHRRAQAVAEEALRLARAYGMDELVTQIQRERMQWGGSVSPD